MASKRASIPAKHLSNGFKRYQLPIRQTRSMATEIRLPNSTLAETIHTSPTETSTSDMATHLQDGISTISLDTPPSPSQIPAVAGASQIPTQPQQNPFLSTTSVTLYTFPTFTPSHFISYPSTHLLLPLRKDLLHRAIIYEGDATRQGTANTKHRSEVRGSGRKIRPQKGTGQARLGDKKSPMLRGGGVAFGPKPRDFATGLQKRVYDRAWRTALSYRYRMGQLLVLSNKALIDTVRQGSRVRWLRELLLWNRLGNADGRTLFVTAKERTSLFDTLEEENIGRHARAVELEDVDVKDLLEMGRLVVERDALEKMFLRHQSDLDPRLRWVRAGREREEEGGEEVVEEFEEGGEIEAEREVLLK